MRFLLKPNWHSFFVQAVALQRSNRLLSSVSSTMQTNRTPTELHEICKVVSSNIGGLDDLESSLNGFTVPITSSLVMQVIESCKHEAHTRRMLRFFSWSLKNLNSDLQDEDFNYAIRVLAEKKDHRAMEILISDLRKGGRAMETQTFGLVAETLVKLGRENEALGIFKNLDKFKCPQDSVTVTAIVNALCLKGHAKRAQGVIYHHKDKISGVESSIYRSLLYGWSLQANVKEARKVIKEMKSIGVMPDLFCYNTFLRCLCEKNLKHNPSGLVPEALNLMMEMRSYRISPNSISYNILLSCLGRTRRVKESCRILEMMKSSGCFPDWVSYYLVAKVLYLSGRFGKGNMIVDEMIEEGLIPDRKFYYDLIGILCGAERVNFALELFERMKRSSMGGYGPVYDVLITKLCMGGDFLKGKELWDEAMTMGVTIGCSSDLLDPSVTKVFKPTKKAEEVCLVEHTPVRIQAQDKKTNSKVKKKMKQAQDKKKKAKVNKKTKGKKRKRKLTST